MNEIITDSYRMSEKTEELFAALCAAQRVMTGAAKVTMNPHFQHKYADLASVWDACRGPLSDNGLTVLQPVSADGPRVTVSTILAHKTGQWIACDLTLTSVKADPQGIGSAITYGRRYGLSAMVGIAPEDDDGNAASGGSKQAQAAVVERKLAAQPKPAPTAMPKKGDASEAFSQMRKQIGDQGYLAVLSRFGYTTEATLSDAEARAVYKAMAEIRKAMVAASHGEGTPGLDEQLFDSLPEASRANLFIELRKRIAGAVGSETATEEYERLRAECETQWALYKALGNAYEFYSKPVVA